MVGLENLSFKPLTLDTWADFERLFGPNGACGGCWCTWSRFLHTGFGCGGFRAPTTTNSVMKRRKTSPERAFGGVKSPVCWLLWRVSRWDGWLWHRGMSSPRWIVHVYWRGWTTNPSGQSIVSLLTGITGAQV